MIPKNVILHTLYIFTKKIKIKIDPVRKIISIKVGKYNNYDSDFVEELNNITCSALVFFNENNITPIVNGEIRKSKKGIKINWIDSSKETLAFTFFYFEGQSITHEINI